MHYDMNWADGAKCDGEEPEFFFPGEPKKNLEKTLEAKTFCQGCTVRLDCLEYSFRENLEYGVYGGLDEDERKEWKYKYLLATRR